MYLGTVEVKNFRCLKDVSFLFRPGLNVLLGENNTGKSALIDALRLLLLPGWSRRDLYVSVDDISHDKDGKQLHEHFEIHATFRGLTSSEQGLFSVILAPSLGSDVAQLHMRYEASKKDRRNRPRIHYWGGEKESESLPTDILSYIQIVYLEALRNALIGLAPGRGSRISKLLQNLVDGEVGEKRIEGFVEAANKNIEEDILVKDAKSRINSLLQDALGEALSQKMDLKLSSPEFRRITQSIRALAGKEIPLEIDENGLGYNNLLYIATVVAELQNEKAIDGIDLPLLLVEEPEAHLHPHLQVLLIDYLEEVCSKQQANPIQAIVTSHSPVLASRADLDSLNLLYLDAENEVRSYPISKCSLDVNEKRKLRRYLDVTKAQLFFAKGILLVEGLSEALLIPELCRIKGHSLEKNGISVVNVQGLSFKPFAKLFQKDALDIPTSLVSDSDPTDDKISSTAQELKNLAGDALHVFLANRNLEYDLAVAGNSIRMAEEYEKLRPRKGKQMAQAMTEGDHEGNACKFLEHFDEKDKASFAQVLSQALSDNPTGFSVPDYISEALNHVIPEFAKGDGS